LFHSAIALPLSPVLGRDYGGNSNLIIPNLGEGDNEKCYIYYKNRNILNHLVNTIFKVTL